ncbi:DUF2142 domain-containing protein [Aeromicrobium sp. zg-636]|uniref:DUF2142 domain-containing protein n=1 Tax=Aeromicrobium senzhongii TaxID=2663859 RepID=A0A8I0EVZ1_9ACTN|nr:MULTISPECIES: DUF2142 domain-containing protein [Aeromicrobium]MBC9226347.1 DUF2142 domain-containing protein [Aeromicrobium senzhongii]
MLFWLSLLAWALSSPVGSSPDDDFHLSSIWCGLGDRQGLCEPSGDPTSRLVPAQIADKPCFAFEPRTPASCVRHVDAGLSEAVWMNADGSYPRLFYAAMATVASDDVGVSVVAMRALNALLGVVLLVAAFWLLPTSLRPALVLSVTATLVPFGLFLMPSTNPSSWAYLSGALVLLCLYGSMKSEGRRRAALGAMAWLAAVLGAGARADSAVFTVFALFLAWLLAGRSVRRPIGPLLTSAVILLCVVALFLSAGQAGSASSGLANDDPALTTAQHVANLIFIPVIMWGGILGWGRLGTLGWLDTPLPGVVPMFTIAAVMVVLGHGLRGAGRRRMMAFVLVVIALWVIPFVLLAQTHAILGSHVQSRYMLPLFVMAVAIATVGVPASRWTGWMSWFVAGAVAIAGSFALHANLRRYTAGVGPFSLDPGGDSRWWWDSTPSPLAVWLIGTVAFALALVVLVVQLRRVAGTSTGTTVEGPGKAPVARSVV